MRKLLRDRAIADAYKFHLAKIISCINVSCDNVLEVVNSDEFYTVSQNVISNIAIHELELLWLQTPAFSSLSGTDFPSVNVMTDDIVKYMITITDKNGISFEKIAHK